MEKLGQDEIDHRQRQVVCISQDSFYRELNPAEKLKAAKGLFNFDHPGNRTLTRERILPFLTCWITALVCFCLQISDAFDNQLILKILQEILDGRVCQIPVYDFITNARFGFSWSIDDSPLVINLHDFDFRRGDEFVTIYPADVVLFEGILVFYLPAVRDFFHMKLFVDTDADTRLSRRGCNLISILLKRVCV